MALSWRPPSSPLSSFSIAAYWNVTRQWNPKRSSGAVHLRELTTWELKETLEVRYDKFAGTLKVMGEEGGLIRCRKGRQKMLWSLGEDGNLKQMKSAEKPPETGSQTIRKSERHGNRLDSINTNA